jgi:hypothetical protein
MAYFLKEGKYKGMYAPIVLKYQQSYAQTSSQGYFNTYDRCVYLRIGY